MHGQYLGCRGRFEPHLQVAGRKRLVKLRASIPEAWNKQGRFPAVKLDKSRVTTTVRETRKDRWAGLLRAMLVLLLVGVTLLALLYAK